MIHNPSIKKKLADPVASIIVDRNRPVLARPSSHGFRLSRLGASHNSVGRGLSIPSVRYQNLSRNTVAIVESDSLVLIHDRKDADCVELYCARSFTHALRLWDRASPRLWALFNTYLAGVIPEKGKKGQPIHNMSFCTLLKLKTRYVRNVATLLTSVSDKSLVLELGNRKSSRIYNCQHS
jgi:hypothetical protein